MIKTFFNILLFLLVYGLVSRSSLVLGDSSEEQKALKPCFLSRNLFPGDKNVDVMKLEVYLEFVLNRHIAPDQFFDEETSNLLKQLQKEEGDQNYTRREIHYSWKNTLQFPKRSTKLFNPQIIIGLKKDQLSCGTDMPPQPLRKGKDNTLQWVELQPINFREGMISHSSCPCPQGEGYRAAIAVLPAVIGNIPGTSFKAMDFIHPDYVHLLSDVSEETFSLSDTEN